MGLFRFFLALAILIGHANNGQYIPPDIFPYIKASGYYGAAKIHCFFLISGFFSDMLLNHRLKHSQSYIKDFYIGRLIRLLPSYYFILFFTFVFVVVAPSLGFAPAVPKRISIDFVYANYEREGWLYIILNLIPFVPETLRFTDFDQRQGMLYLLVTQSWSLSVEYFCLLVAPFLFRHNRLYLFSIAFFFIIAVMLAGEGVYRNYVLTTTIFFLLGSVAYRIYTCWFAQRQMTLGYKILILAVLAGLVIYLCFFGFIARSLGLYLTYTLFMGLSFISLPVLFAGSRTFLRDRWIGDLAYPMYLNHALILWILWRYRLDPQIVWWIAPSLSIFLAILMMVLIDHPLQRWRHKYYAKHSVSGTKETS